MRRRFVLAGTLALLGALASAAALADSGSGPTKTLGTASGLGSGNVARTISDVPEPNGPQSIQSTVVNVPVSPGQTANTITTNLRDAINANGTLISAGYSAKLIYAPTGEARLKMTRQVGSYSSGDVVSGPLTGYSVNPDLFTSADAPALSPVGLVSLFGALPALAYWHRRRKARAA